VKTERFTLDTNILIYSVHRAAGDRHRSAVEIVRRASRGECWLTLQSISEFYSAATRKRIARPDEAAATAADWLDLFPTMAPSSQAFRAALALAASRQAAYWDALLVATAAEAGCTAILTEDLADGATLHGVRIVNPFGRDELTEPARRLLFPGG